MELDITELQYLRGLIMNDKIVNDYENNPNVGISQVKSMHTFTDDLLEKLDEEEPS
ncbi:hypothetical protein [Alkalibacillus almallahensis]|uniref:hypothetical protein n=1 Tax=Alkalibacillus almallahensis TaxID=1379154 RepID=UPI00141E9DE6|nr:hypothetical protein [Alkalibacillus almallahensis]NIK12851.1 hypothetical protein [Alkalibacillus almallahensis]